MISPSHFLKDHPLAGQIRRELHLTFIKEMVSRMPFSLLTLVAIGFFFNDSNSIQVMLYWYAGAGMVGVLSFFILRAHKRYLDAQAEYSYVQYQRWRLVVYGIAIMWGGLYSSVSLLFFPNANEVEIITVVIILILNASIPSMTKGNDPWVYILFVVPVFSCFTWQVYHLGIEQYWLLTFMVPIACVSLIVFSLMTHKDQMEHSALRILYKEAEIKAVNASVEKTRFLAAASHDLRQPLQSTQLYLGAIRPEQVTPDAQPLIDKAKRAALSGNRLLDKLLDISALDGEGVKPVMQTLPLLQTLQKLEDQYEPLAKEKGLYLRVDKVDVLARYDEQFFLQILQNLVANGIKYTSKGGVEVRCELAGNQLNIHIKDTGIGISKANQIHVFDEFFQVQGTGQNKEIGMGLGLSIVKRLCALQNIEVSLESTPNVGTMFTLGLTLTTQHVPGENTRTQGVAGSVKVLLCEQDSVITDTISEALVDIGADVWVADSLETLEHLAKQLAMPPQVCLCSEALWDETTSDIFTLYFPEAEIILMTPVGSQRDHGTLPVLTKPLSLDLLKATLEPWLEPSLKGR